MMGAIQAGGLSSRMGQDKAWLLIGGRPLIEHALAAVEPVVESMALVTSKARAMDPRYPELAARWHARLLEDSRPGCGPLGGIETSLITAGEAVLAVGCDLPFVTTEILLKLCRIHETAANAATISIDRSGRLQPLVGIYGLRCLGQITAQLDSGDYKIDQLFSRVPTQFVPFDDGFFTNINTPEEYSEILDAWPRKRQ